MWITTNLPNVWRGTLWSQRLECSHYFRAHEAFMIRLLPNTQISKVANLPEQQCRLNVMDDPNTPSFGKGLLKFCYKRLCCQIWKMYNCLLGPKMRHRRRWKVQRIGEQWNSVETTSPASHMRAVTTICWELTLFSCTSSLPPCPKRISSPSRSGLQLNNIC